MRRSDRAAFLLMVGSFKHLILNDKCGVDTFSFTTNQMFASSLYLLSQYGVKRTAGHSLQKAALLASVSIFEDRPLSLLEPSGFTDRLTRVKHCRNVL